jgi:undecaprenyl-diphosphatase
VAALPRDDPPPFPVGRIPSPEDFAIVRELDRRIEAVLERAHNPVFDAIAYSLSSAADHSLLWFAIGALRARRRGDLGFALRFGAVMGAESALTNGGVKSLFRRVRPEHEVTDGPLPYGMRRPITSSFPSGHATAAFTAAAVLTRSGHRPGRAVAWYGLASAVALSRAYTRMHHASDVVAGATLGAAFGAAANRLFAPESHRARNR